MSKAVVSKYIRDNKTQELLNVVSKSNVFFIIKKIAENRKYEMLRRLSEHPFIKLGSLNSETLYWIYNSYLIRNYISIDVVKGSEDSRDKAEKAIDYFSTLVTGVRSEESVVGNNKQSKDAIITLTGGVVPPSKKVLDNIRLHPDLWGKFLFQLGKIDFFNKLTIEEREKWLGDNEKEEDIYFEDIPGLKIQIQQMGTQDPKHTNFFNLNDEQINEISSGNVFPITYVYDMFPKKPGSAGIGAKKRHTLFFRRSLWRVVSIYKRTKEFDGPIINVDEGIIEDGGKAKTNENIIIFDSFASDHTYDTKTKKYKVSSRQPIGFKYTSYPNPKKEDYIKMLNDKFKGKTMKDYNNILKGTEGFTPAGYKSLLQKIVRFRPKKVDIGRIKYNSKYAACAVFTILINNKGSFVPDIQRFVTGLESSLKRLIVIAMEDSIVPDEKNTLIFTSLAFLSQRINGWKLNVKAYEKAIDYLSSLIDSSKTQIHNFKKGASLKPYVINKHSKSLEIVSSLMDEIRSFQNDLNMMRYIAYAWYRNETEFIEDDIQPEVMPLEHCIDQHWAPEVIYFYSGEIEISSSSKSKPYLNIILKLFREITGVNPRKNPVRKIKGSRYKPYSLDFEQRPFVKKFREAQNLVLISKLRPSTKRVKSKGSYPLKYELDSSWLSGMLGPIIVKPGPLALVTLDPNNLHKLIAFKKPSRGMKTPFLSDFQQDKAISMAKEKMKKGLPLNKVYPGIDKFKGIKLYYIKSGEEWIYYIKKGNQMTSWGSYKKGKVNIPYIKNVDLNLKNALIYTGEGIIKDRNEKLHSMLSDYDIMEIKRVLTYISGFDSTFEIPRLGREGGGTKQAVSKYDSSAFKMLLILSLIYPSAIMRLGNSVHKYKVKVGPLLWEIKRTIRDHLENINPESKTESSKWGKIEEIGGRVLYSYQISSVDEMKNAHALGRKGHFINIPVGMGKTKIVLTYLKWLLDHGTLPSFVIYTLPPSAIKSVIHEIKLMGFKYSIMNPIKTVPRSELYRYPNGKIRPEVVHGDLGLRPYVINLIKHDHMRMMSDSLAGRAPKSIFIIDEVHKALNETIRTAVSLQTSKLCQEFIAMTGTPIIDSKTYKLIWWLEQIVPFGVNERNFWVAVNAMVSKKVNTGVDEVRENIEMFLSDKEEKIYHKLVPSKLGGTNSQPRPEDIKMALKMCYDVVTNGMVDLILENYEKGAFVVAKDIEHQRSIQEALIERGIASKDIFLITKNDSLYLTDDEVKKGKVRDYRIVITTKYKSTGYGLTRLKVMISTVYPSNNATREQLDGRINRIGQKSKKVWYYVLHCGILTYILENHDDARNLSAILSTLSETV